MSYSCLFAPSISSDRGVERRTEAKGENSEPTGRQEPIVLMIRLKLQGSALGPRIR